MLLAKNKKRRISKAVAKIQSFRKMIKARREFLAKKHAVSKIERFARIVLAKRVLKRRKQHIVKLQAFVKMRIAHRKYIVQREQSSLYIRRKKIEEAK